MPYFFIYSAITENIQAARWRACRCGQPVPDDGQRLGVTLVGDPQLGCGCVTGRYREVATNREITYVEEKGAGCSQHAHRRNHTIATSRAAVYALSAKAS